MASLDLATQQLVIIARALAQDARVLILDEPTAALTEGESHRLFDRMRALRAEGRGDHLRFASPGRSLCHLRPHRRHARRPHLRRPPDERTYRGETVVAEMVGDIAAAERGRRREQSGAAALAVTGLRVFDPAAENRLRVDDLDLTVRQGEIVGLFGLLGAGSIEAALAIYGAWPGKTRGRDRRRRRGRLTINSAGGRRSSRARL